MNIGCATIRYIDELCDILGELQTLDSSVHVENSRQDDTKRAMRALLLVRQPQFTLCRACLSDQQSVVSDPPMLSASPVLRELAMELAAAISIILSPVLREETIGALFSTGVKHSILDRVSVHGNL